MTFDEAKRIVNEYFAKLEAEMQAEAAKQGEVNRKNGEAFLTENAKREGIKVTESGLQYEVLESGKATHQRHPTTLKYTTPANSSTAPCLTALWSAACRHRSASHR